MKRNNIIFPAIIILLFSVFFVFAQDGENVPDTDLQPAPETANPETAKPEKVTESVTFRYEFIPDESVHYLFSSKTEANVKIHNLDDPDKTKEFYTVLDSDTLLKLTTTSMENFGFDLDVAIKQIGASYRTNEENLEFMITQRGMTTMVDGERDKEIRELNLWESGNWRENPPEGLDKPVAHFSISEDGKITKAYSITTSGDLVEQGAKKSLLMLQNPLTLVNLIFWQLPKDKQVFDRLGSNPLAGKPAWNSTIKFPFASPFEFDSTESIVELHKINEYKLTKSQADVAEVTESEIGKVYKFYRQILNDNFKDWDVKSWLEYDLNSRLPSVVTYHIKRNYELEPTGNRKVEISQSTVYRFLLQK